MASIAISFFNCLGNEGIECCNGQFDMDNNIESYRCGAKVNASFCEDYPYKRWNADQLRWDFSCRTDYELFSTTGPSGSF